MHLSSYNCWHITFAALPGSAASHASFMAFISSCLSVSFFTSISSYETKPEPSLANSYKNLHHSKKKKGFVLTVRSKFICCRFAFAEPLDWFDEVVQRSLANHMQQKKKHVFFQPIRNKNTFVLSVFPRLILVASFSHLASIVYSLRLAPATGFPAFGPDSMFPAFATDCLFPAVGTDCMISCVWYRLHDFPRMAPIVCFPRLAPVAWFPEFGTDCMFPAFGIGYTSGVFGLVGYACCDWSGVRRQSFRLE